jgi:protein CpxP
MQTMKKSMLIIPLLAVGLSTGFGVQSSLAFNAGCGNGPGGLNEGRGLRQERMAEVLGLSAAQQQQIQTLRQQARKEMDPLREQLTATRGKLRTLVNAESYDENAVRSLASEQAASRTELLVIQTRMQHQIHALFTPEQRLLAEKLQPLLQARRGHGGGRPAPDAEEL